MSVYTDMLLGRAKRGNARNIAAVRTATRSVERPEHGLMHKGQKRTPPGDGVGKPLHGDKRTTKTRADYVPTSYEFAMIRCANLPANTYHNITSTLGD